MGETVGLLNFSADRPVHYVEDDLLGRGGFAIAIANAICNWRDKESLVLAIYGPWGAGKSSVKNMVVSLLGKREQNKPKVVEFNPWEWSGGDRLQEVFFDEIETAVRQGERSVDAEELSKKWKQYAARLALGSTALEQIRTASEVAGMPWVPLVCGAVSSALKRASTVSDDAAKAYTADAASKSLDDLKKSLGSELMKLEAPILVVVDDIDRLHPEEIRTLFRLIKVNADFPNVLYLLLFDRHIVERALDEASSDTGRRYLEKIVQAGFDLPKASSVSLGEQLVASLNKLLGDVALSRTFDEIRWQNLCSEGIMPYCQSLRKVRRFISSLSFQIGLHLRDGTLEVNVIDLIGVEALRVFEPEVYRFLSSHPQMIFGDQYSFTEGGKSREEKKQFVDVLLKLACEDTRDAAKGILRELFPQIEWAIKGYGNEEHVGFDDGWIQKLRICHRDLFERYFVMSVPQEDVSQAVIDNIIEASGNHKRLRAQFEELIKKNAFVKVLKRLEFYKSTLDVANAEEFASALFDVGDQLSVDFGGVFNLTPDLIACRILYHYLIREKNQKRRNQILLTAIENSVGYWLPIRFVSINDPSSSGSKSLGQLLDVEGFEKAKGFCLERIRGLAKQQSLSGPRMGYYLWRWLQWTDSEEPRKWVDSLTIDLEGALKFIDAIKLEVHGSSGFDRYTKYELRLQDVSAFTNEERIRKILEPVLKIEHTENAERLASEYRNAVQAAKAAFQDAQGEKNVDS